MSSRQNVKKAFRDVARAIVTGQMDERIGLAWTVFSRSLPTGDIVVLPTDWGRQIEAAIRNEDEDPFVLVVDLIKSWFPRDVAPESHWCAPNCIDPDTWDPNSPLNEGREPPDGAFLRNQDADGAS